MVTDLKKWNEAKEHKVVLYYLQAKIAYKLQYVLNWWTHQWDL